jgi:hypothetical protein
MREGRMFDFGIATLISFIGSFDTELPKPRME